MVDFADLLQLSQGGETLVPSLLRYSTPRSPLARGAFLIAALLMAQHPRFASGQEAAPVGERLTAIDILLLPDQTMIDAAQRANARLRADYPQGFALDATHRPHITLAQRYVLTRELPNVYAAVAKVFDCERPAGWELEATGYFNVVFAGMPLAGIVVEPTPQLRRLQRQIIDAVAPYTQPRGTAAAFYRTKAEPGINLSTIEYVDTFVPKEVGEKYGPHVTIGVGQPALVARMKAAPFARFKFKVAGAAVYHLGNWGTAAKELWRWQPEETASTTPEAAVAGDDPLPSWNEGAAKRAILEFVGKVTTPGTPSFVVEDKRIAAFDNDGTLWCEMPIYVQCQFLIDRVKALAPEHPEWKDKEPFKAVLENNAAAVIASGELGINEIGMNTQAGLTPSDFERIVSDWLATARHPRFKRPYTSLAYQPMLELLAYLRAKGFKTFVVSGGGIEFMRPWTPRVYGIPPYQVVGSSIKSKYELEGDTPILRRVPQVNFIDDFAGKPVGINQYIGLRPLATFGNSDGDYEMLRWTTAGDGPRFGLIVHHTDAVREYAYDYPSPVGQLKVALEEAPRRGWTVVSMKDDWKSIFSAESK